MTMQTAEEKPKYKSVHVHYFEADFDQFLIAELQGHIGNPRWEFRIFDLKKEAWTGTLRELTEMVLLGAIYKDKLQQEAKEKGQCQKLTPLTPENSETKPKRQEDTGTPS